MIRYVIKYSSIVCMLLLLWSVPSVAHAAELSYPVYNPKVSTTITTYYGRTVFVGDSRTVGMVLYTTDSTVKKSAIKSYNDFILYDKQVDCLAYGGKGYSWMKDNLDTDYYDTYIFWMGVNDLTNIDKYKAYYEDLVSKNKTVIICTVGLVDEVKESSYGYKVKNKSIEDFNKSIKELSDVTIIDVYKYMADNGLGTSADGLHYTKQTYNDIYEYICSKLN